MPSQSERSQNTCASAFATATNSSKQTSTVCHQRYHATNLFREQFTCINTLAAETHALLLFDFADPLSSNRTTAEASVREALTGVRPCHNCSIFFIIKGSGLPVTIFRFPATANSLTGLPRMILYVLNVHKIGNMFEMMMKPATRAKLGFERTTADVLYCLLE